MNILHINTLDCRGGAARMATRLRGGLVQRGHVCSMAVAHQAEATSNVALLPKLSSQTRLRRRLEWFGLAHYTYRYLIRQPYFQTAEIVNLHNLHHVPDPYFDMVDLPQLSRDKTTVWTLHDPWLIHEFGTTPEYDAIFPSMGARATRIKREAVRKARVTFTAPSRWLCDLTRRHYPQHSVELLRYGVNLSVFRPCDRVVARAALGIGSEAKVVLFVANEGEDNVPKGTMFLRSARDALERFGVQFISLGSSRLSTYISSESQLALYYNAADVFALPSLAENSPVTILEAMACGLPTVAFKTGGISESVVHMENGYLANYRDGEDFTRGLSLILGDDVLRTAMSEECVVRATALFDLKRMLDEYLDLYRTLR